MVVKQICNLFELMDLFAREKKPLSVRDIVEEFGWPRSSAFNIINTLVDCGFLYQPTPRGGYCPTGKWMELATELTNAQPLPNSMHVLLEELSEQTGETICLATAQGNNIVFLDVVESSADIRFIANIGQRLPIHVTAAGRAILSQYSPAERASVLKRIKYQAYVKDTYMSAESVEQDIQNNAETRCFSNMGIYAPGVAGVAVPFPFNGQRNALALSGPVPRIEPHIEAIGRMLLRAVEQFTKQNS